MHPGTHDHFLVDENRFVCCRSMGTSTVLTIENRVDAGFLDPLHLCLYQNYDETNSGTFETLVWKKASAQSGGKIILTIPKAVQCTASVFPSDGVELRSKEIEVVESKRLLVETCSRASDAPALKVSSSDHRTYTGITIGSP